MSVSLSCLTGSGRTNRSPDNLALGGRLGVTFVVEGIETEVQRVCLNAKATDQLQRFVF